ncbi:hypothetical protein SAMN02787118_106444 [Streptomyces mirabilis]|uniref:Uncharacterized protein n=1 Tax=Streptomyces mirabilis TaxID=68239 RepID=A0A1I2IN27_9ACTN|nr:hypothetical protein SAMN02787118_106444 [Streptomyces mirabilis]
MAPVRPDFLHRTHRGPVPFPAHPPLSPSWSSVLRNGRGPAGCQVGVDEAGFVFVGVDDPTTAAPLLRKAFGARHIEVGYAEQASLLSTTG